MTDFLAGRGMSMIAKKLWLSVGLMLGLSSVLAAQNPPPPPVTPPVVTPAQATAAQQAAAVLGKDVTNEQIANAIRQSGLSEQQIKVRLHAAGYDTTLADPFFGRAARRAAEPGAVGVAQSDTFLQALQRIGIVIGGQGSESNAPSAEATARTTVERTGRRISTVFGKDIFDRASTAFDPITSGPVDAAYRLGIGDALQLVVTGQVELAYALEVRRDGSVIIPQVGQVSLAGHTLEAARTVLRERMAKSYSGLASGEARLDLSISRLRSNAVFAIGEVENPGALQVNALATVFHAVARAGGPTERGSFRAVEVRRANRVIQTLDLYDYLLTGNAVGDIRLEQGDVIFVPLAHRVIAVKGEVRRPRTFELRDSEGFNDLLRFAGGLLPTASVERVQIDRILPAEQRRPGLERVKVDVELKGRVDSLAEVQLLDGDIVTVFNIGDLRRNVVSLGGEVFQPGEYDLGRNPTLGAVIENAQGLLPWALRDRVKLVRQVPATGRRELFSLDVSSPAGREFVLQEFDSVEVLDGRRAFPGGQISLDGAINLPATRVFVERESLRDAIERSGGLREDAQRIRVARRKLGAYYSDTTSVVYRFDISPTTFARDSVIAAFRLERDDHVFVDGSPGFRPQQFVTVEGAFRVPGAYAITENVDRVSDVVQRAGGALPGAYGETFSLGRDGKRVSVDFARALRGDPAQNLPLRGGDRLVIDQDPRTVFVTGAVSRPSLIRFRSGLGVRDYIELAGGPTEKGMADHAIVEYPSGFSRRIRRVALIFHSSPDVVSGAMITVPERPESKTSSGEMWTRVFQSATALASLVLAYAAVTR